MALETTRVYIEDDMGMVGPVEEFNDHFNGEGRPVAELARMLGQVVPMSTEAGDMAEMARWYTPAAFKQFVVPPFSRDEEVLFDEVFANSAPEREEQ